MGWSSGTELFSSLITTLKKNVPEKAIRKHIYKDMISAFQDHDWDNLDEPVGDDKAYDEVYKKILKDEGIEYE